jgi:hypothetical protein
MSVEVYCSRNCTVTKMIGLTGGLQCDWWFMEMDLTRKGTPSQIITARIDRKTST